LRFSAEKLGFSARQSLHVEAGFQWPSLYSALQNQNLFSEKTLIELYHPSAKFDDEAKSILLKYLAKPNPDTIFVILCEKLSPSSSRFSSLDSR
jgi:DNA polymerase-3 subunit delta